MALGWMAGPVCLSFTPPWREQPEAGRLLRIAPPRPAPAEVVGTQGWGGRTGLAMQKRHSLFQGRSKGCGPVYGGKFVGDQGWLHGKIESCREGQGKGMGSGVRRGRKKVRKRRWTRAQKVSGSWV